MGLLSICKQSISNLTLQVLCVSLLCLEENIKYNPKPGPFTIDPVCTRKKHEELDEIQGIEEFSNVAVKEANRR